MTTHYHFHVGLWWGSDGDQRDPWVSPPMDADHADAYEAMYAKRDEWPGKRAEYGADCVWCRAWNVTSFETPADDYEKQVALHQAEALLAEARR